jgi:acyl-CoA hydrolase
MMQRRLFLTALLAFGLLQACGRKTVYPPIAPGSPVLAFGDSVTFGTGALAGEDWPALLARQTGWKIHNAGIPGDTTEAGKTRIQEMLDLATPAMVIVEMGGNDFLRRRPPKMVKEDLRAIIRSIKRSGAQVVLVAVPELSLLSMVARKPSDSPIYKELAAEENIPLISDVFSDILAQPALCADQIHPNAKGYEVMAGEFLNALRKFGLSR